MVRQVLAGVLLIITVGSCARRSEEVSRTAAEVPQAVEIEGMAKAVQVGDLVIGGQPSADALGRLADEGYRTIVSTRGPGELSWDEKAKVESLGMTFVSIPMSNPVTEITDEQVGRFAELMKHGERPMVLHCGSGNRVAGLWAVWLVEHQGVGPAEALRRAQRAGMTRMRPVVEKRLGLTAGED